MKTSQFMSHIPCDLKKKAKVKATLEDIPMTRLLAEWLKLWVEGKLPTPNLKSEKKNVKGKK